MHTERDGEVVAVAFVAVAASLVARLCSSELKDRFSGGSAPYQGSENGHQADQNGASLMAGGIHGFEVQQVENCEAFVGAASRGRVDLRVRRA